jgi:hypothetical protein
MIERARVALTAKLRQSTESRISSYGCAYRPIRSWRVGDSSDPHTTRPGTFRWEKQARLRRFPADSRSFWQFHCRLFSGKTQINSLPLRKSKGQCSGAKFGTRDACEIERAFHAGDAGLITSTGSGGRRSGGSPSIARNSDSKAFLAAGILFSNARKAFMMASVRCL